jgi:glycosyltransferase involved in cell wall biosynthesis
VPLLSVLLPVANGAETVDLAIRSTLRALPRDGELVVLDDGSTDETPVILDRFEDRRLRIQRNPQPMGVAASLQTLLEGTDSEYVGRMDADDVSLPGRFKRSMWHLDREADLAFSPIISFRMDPFRVRPGLPLGISAEAMPLHMLVHNPLCHPTMVARRSALELAGGYRTVLAEDHDLWLRALAAGARLVRTAQPGLAYRHHHKQISVQRTYIAQAFAQPVLRSAYTDFVRQQFGVEPFWLDALWSLSSDTEDTTGSLFDLMAMVTGLSHSLPLIQRRVLRRTTRHLRTMAESRSPR